MSTGCVVRELAAGELDALLRLYTHLHAQDAPLPAREVVEATWQRLLRDSAHLYMGGFVGEMLVAACNAALIPNLTRGARPYALIENVVCDAQHRRRGYAGGVMRAVIERCKAAGCYKVMLMSGLHRAEQHGFYDALGFQRSKQAFVLDLR